MTGNPTNSFIVQKKGHSRHFKKESHLRVNLRPLISCRSIGDVAAHATSHPNICVEIPHLRKKSKSKFFGIGVPNMQTRFCKQPSQNTQTTHCATQLRRVTLDRQHLSITSGECQLLSYRNHYTPEQSICTTELMIGIAD